ncbi:MAG: DUF86 domain-containing protein [Anaerolineales bacterium]|nr:MAG: DUF86 domain-containing protein [Anaerolineales bacterium]
MDEQDVIQERLKLLSDYTNDLLELQNVDLTTYTENKLIRRTVERTLDLAVEACLDIGQHIIVREGFRTPGDNKDVFLVLSEEGIIPSEFLPNLVSMARFRNLIVHDYAHIDNSVVFSILKRRLGDFDACAQAVTGYLEAEH